MADSQEPITKSQEQMTKLGVGIVGLGPRWRRHYRPALHALREQFSIRAVSDARHERAVRIARRFRCEATGIVQLFERKDVQAIMLLDTAWHGLWPVEIAGRFGKPVFCAVPLDADLEHADAVCEKVNEAKLPVMPVLVPRAAPATARLQRLLAEQLGAPRLLLCERRGTNPGRIGIGLLDWCMQLFGAAAPIQTRVTGSATDTFEELFADFGGGRWAIVRRWSGPHVRPATRLRLVAERGTALATLPNRVRWNDAEGRHAFVATEPRPVLEVLLERFYQAVTGGQPMQPSLAEARQALNWLRSAEVAEGCRVRETHP